MHHPQNRNLQGSDLAVFRLYDRISYLHPHIQRNPMYTFLNTRMQTYNQYFHLSQSTYSYRFASLIIRNFSITRNRSGLSNELLFFHNIQKTLNIFPDITFKHCGSCNNNMLRHPALPAHCSVIHLRLLRYQPDNVSLPSSFSDHGFSVWCTEYISVRQIPD